ncbi:MAG: A/G-specific adenine glycosylase [Phycisphaerae bacterium]
MPLRIPPASLTALRRVLRRWYRRERRDLPWRLTRDPYRIWVSEIMLQQTRVETVTPFYERFLETFPTVELLAAAAPQRVLKLWEGLGYYSRARNLHAAARQLVRAHGGKLPRDAIGWRALPGVGRYTAAAIASIAFGEPVAVLDSNVKRVLARLSAITSPVSNKRTTDALWAHASALLDHAAPGDFNQALMELGATLCLPRRPACERCPLRRWCVARRIGKEESLPTRRPTPATPRRRSVALLASRRGRILLSQRPARGLLGGLWELPNAAIDARDTNNGARRASELARKLRLGAPRSDSRRAYRHAFTHFVQDLQVYACRVVLGRRAAPPGMRWTSAADRESLPLTRLCRRVLESAVWQDQPGCEGLTELSFAAIESGDQGAAAT